VSNLAPLEAVFDAPAIYLMPAPIGEKMLKVEPKKLQQLEPDILMV
jgi:hypothetical protein